MFTIKNQNFYILKQPNVAWLDNDCLNDAIIVRRCPLTFPHLDLF